MGQRSNDWPSCAQELREQEEAIAGDGLLADTPESLTQEEDLTDATLRPPKRSEELLEARRAQRVSRSP